MKTIILEAKKTDLQVFINLNLTGTINSHFWY